MTDVTVAVVTYRRPDDLRAVLPMLLAQLADVDGHAEVLVVDNDPDGGAGNGGAAAVVAARADRRVRYVHEPQPGIAAARNRALDESGAADVLVFIDDDERPVAGWLAALLATHRELRPAAVAGPVRSEFSSEPDPWIVAGGFFQRRALPTGTPVDRAATNNLLLDMRAVRDLGLRFDLRYGLTGGSDNLFTRQLTDRGGQLVWCAEAGVIDVVPAQRLTRSWVLRRAFRMGNGTALVERDVAGRGWPAVAVRARLLVAGMTRIVGGAARFLAGTVGGSLVQRAAGARNLARGAGLVAGAAGLSYSEYGRRKTSGAGISRGSNE